MKLAARTKGKKGEHFKLIKDGKNLSDAINIYSIPLVTNDNSHEYDFEHGIHESEWYYVKIDEEQKQTMVNPYLAINKSSVDKNPLPTEFYSKVEVIYLVHDDNKIIFTKITPGNYIQNQKLAFLKNGDAHIVDRTESIELSGWVDAYYDGADRIYFHKLEKIKNIFPGVEVFYREASREEKSTFVEADIFENIGIDIDHVSPRIAKKIRMINESGLDFSNPDIQQTALEYAAQFADYVKVSPEGKFVISDNKSLEAALNILNVRYYKSPFTDESFEARSIKSLA